MVRLFVVLGFALLAGGAYAIVDGWPYRVLERGFTEVILGGLSAVAGLTLLALAAVLAEIRRLKGLVSGAMAAVALSEPRSEERAASTVAPSRAEPVLEKAPASEIGPVGIATTLVAGAGAAVVAGALTGLGKDDDKPEQKAADETEAADEPEGDEATRSDRAQTITAEPLQAPAAEASRFDDWLLPPVAPVLDVAPSAIDPDERGGVDEPDDKAVTSQEDEEGSIPADVDKAVRRDDEEDEADPVAVPDKEPEAAPSHGDKDAEKPAEAAPASEAEDRLWWPRIDHPAPRAETSSVDDEFNALRDQLSGVVNAPEIEPPRRDRDLPGSAESWAAPRPWPPVTQPRDPVALSEAEVEAADKALPEEEKAEDEKAEPVSEAKEPAAPEPKPEQQDEPVPAEAKEPQAEKTEAPAAESKPDEEPAASDEGVIGAYQVGETQFTMFADGSIHARTPDGDYTFASMDELKAYLASEKSKLEP